MKTITIIILSIATIVGGAFAPIAYGGEVQEVTDKRYEVFFVGSFPGCSATTLSFRDDEIFTLDCIDGFGVYQSLLDSFSATFWAPDYYLGRGVALFFTGITFDPFIIAVGVAVVGSDARPILLTGYLLSTSLNIQNP